jgi:hypothetical protein
MFTSVRVRYLVLTVAVILSTTVYRNPAQAAPGTDIWTDFYDCGMNQVGEKFRGCDSTGFNWGQLSGEFKSIESDACEGTTGSINWYKWNGSNWVFLPDGEPAPDC